MTCLFSDTLQRAVFERLSTDAEVSALVGAAIFDAPPEGDDPVDDEYIVIGEERVRPNNTATSTGALLDFDVIAYSRRDGFTRLKQIAAAICEGLVDAPLALDGGHLVALRFLRARADRGRSPVKRALSIRFRAVIDGV